MLFYVKPTGFINLLQVRSIYLPTFILVDIYRLIQNKLAFAEGKILTK
jgi:hypothetical protein